MATPTHTSSWLRTHSGLPGQERTGTIANEPTTGILAFALELADAADAVAMRDYRTAHAIERKADGTFVTPADREIEALLRERIAERYPAHAILGEEEGGGQAPEGGEARWILDPIDGTHNYMRGIPVWGTLIACERGGSVEVGVVSAPALGTRWWAGRGLGAYRGATGRASGGAPPGRASASVCPRSIRSPRRRSCTGRRSGRSNAGRAHGRCSGTPGACAASATSGASASSPRAPPT